MNFNDSLPRVLTTPKLHRRPQVDITANSPELQKHRWPPIDTTKDASGDFFVIETTANIQEKSRVDHNGHLVNEETQLPLSPANGVSAACAAMANACSHDHDYISSDSSRLGRLNPDVASASRPASPSKLFEDSVPRVRLEIKTVRVPVPPKSHAPTSPRDAKPARTTGNKLIRRYIRPDDVTETRRGRPSKTQEPHEVIDNKFVFVSTRKTAESTPGRVSAGRRRIRKKTTPDFVTAQEHSRKTTSFASDVAGVAVKEEISVNNDEKFDLSNDILTKEWLKMVQRYRTEKRQNDEGPDDAETENFGKPLRESTPVRNAESSNANTELKFLSPRPSVTPCPPNLSKTGMKSKNGELNDSNVVGDDSAYFSITSSVCSRPTSSAGMPTFRAASGSRPPTGGRPQSGEKRVAATSLSSSSSCTASSDDDSEFGSMTSPKSDLGDVENCRTSGERVTSSGNSRCGSGGSCKDQRAVKSRKGKKIVRQIDVNCAKKAITKPQMRPMPPRKPKKDPLPMHLRALPNSFFQEPNRVSPSPYSVLPPVQPLFRQVSTDDIADVRPVTPPSKEDASTTSSMKRGAKIITTGDIELLQRLFDAVEPQNKATGIRIKRGRPKRTPKLMPSPRLKLDNNPCIMQSITEKLFPKLTIDRRRVNSMRTANVTGLVSTTQPAAFIGDVQSLNTNFNNNAQDLDSTYLRDWSSSGLLSTKSSFTSVYDDDKDFPEVSMETRSPTPQRLETLALPLLTGTQQDYSQMLSEVAAVL